MPNTAAAHVIFFSEKINLDISCELADDSHEISKFIFSEKKKKKKKMSGTNFAWHFKG